LQTKSAIGCRASREHKQRFPVHMWVFNSMCGTRVLSNRTMRMLVDGLRRLTARTTHTDVGQRYAHKSWKFYDPYFLQNQKLKLIAFWAKICLRVQDRRWIYIAQYAIVRAASCGKNYGNH